jgi:hypothetical protein
MMYGILSISGLSGRHQARKRQHRSFRRRSALVAKVVKQGPMDHAKCIEFWGSEVEACGEFRK